jgi:hypothetical protein
MNFDTFIDAAWNEHADHPEEVGERLAGSLGLVDAPEHIAPFVRLVTHVYGEHLGQWERGIALVESVRGLPSWDGSAAVDGAVARSVAVLRYASGDRAALARLSREDCIAALATASSAFLGRDDSERALAAYTDATELADAGLPEGSPALRALAVGGNNLAAALETKANRDDAETRGMIAAAQGGLKYWKLAGTWLEEERAEYRLARSLLQAGDATAALESARRCIDVCARNDAPPFEEFFGYTVLALAQRAAGQHEGFDASRRQALERYGRVAADERQWCAAELEELGH